MNHFIERGYHMNIWQHALFSYLCRRNLHGDFVFKESQIVSIILQT